MNSHPTHRLANSHNAPVAKNSPTSSDFAGDIALGRPPREIENYNTHTGPHGDLLNEFDERLEDLGDVVLNREYWDCDCDRGYIHPIALTTCAVCGRAQEECPASRESEVQQYIRRFTADKSP